MNKTKWLLLVYFLVVVAAAADLAWLYPQLPERVASHFNGSGEPDGWSSKAGLLQSQIIVMLVLTLSFPGILLLMPLLPASMINLPNKDYWLAPERADYTRERVGQYLLWMGIVTLAFLVLLNHGMMWANLHPPPRLGTRFYFALGGFLLVETGLVIRMLLEFRKPRE